MKANKISFVFRFEGRPSPTHSFQTNSLNKHEQEMLLPMPAEKTPPPSAVLSITCVGLKWGVKERSQEAVVFILLTELLF